MLKKFLFILFCSLCSFFLSGCFSKLPEINLVGKNREEIVRIFASNPEKAWGTHIHICTPLKNTPPYHCCNNLYFKTVDEALADKRIQQAPAARMMPTGCFIRLLPQPPRHAVRKRKKAARFLLPPSVKLFYIRIAKAI
jgi:hypothetical protein